MAASESSTPDELQQRASDRDDQGFRALLAEGIEGPVAGPLDADYFEKARQRVRASHP